MSKRHGKRKFNGRNYHHLIPKCRGGNVNRKNLLLIHEGRHRAWHECFGTLSLSEVIDLLIRLEKVKALQRYDS